MDDAINGLRGIGYGPSGKLMDVHRPVGDPMGTVLLWHGRAREERDVLAPLARQVADLGLLVLVPDWRSDEPDGGWTHLHESVDFLREHAARWGGDPERTVLAGWSLGARAALATVLRPPRQGWHPAAVVAAAGNYLTSHDPRMGPPAIEDLAVTEQPPRPVWLVHGTADAVVGVRSAREFAPALERHGWPGGYAECDSDHAGVVLAEYDPVRGRCGAAVSERAVHAGMMTAQVIAKAAPGL
jgi:predicted esterase